MQWTDEQIGDIRKLASEGFTRRETADKLGISYDALQGKSKTAWDRVPEATEK